MVSVYSLKKPHNTTPLKITPLNDPLWSTKIAEWELKLFLSNPTRPPQHTEAHWVVAWFSGRGADRLWWPGGMQTSPFPTREAGDPNGDHRKGEMSRGSATLEMSVDDEDQIYLVSYGWRTVTKPRRSHCVWITLMFGLYTAWLVCSVLVIHGA